MRIAVCSLLLSILCAAPAAALAASPVDDLLLQAFPGASAVEKRIVFLSDAQRRKAESLAKAPIHSQMAAVHIARRGQEAVGYAMTESHVVRTKGETVAVLLDPDGRVRSVEILAFHEPPEYSPNGRWLSQFAGLVLSDDLWLRRSIHAVSGATLSAQAVTAGVRRLLAVWTVAVKEK